mmetsp:Transcript_1277/g.3869  ORF Transcript_1277/g.3869 Transcript_1277/m.3869 type:complete len:222 (+) Transcript_1277:740-1405(+)
MGVMAQTEAGPGVCDDPPGVGDELVELVEAVGHALGVGDGLLEGVVVALEDLLDDLGGYSELRAERLVLAISEVEGGEGRLAASSREDAQLAELLGAVVEELEAREAVVDEDASVRHLRAVDVEPLVLDGDADLVLDREPELGNARLGGQADQSGHLALERVHAQRFVGIVVRLVVLARPARAELLAMLRFRRQHRDQVVHRPERGREVGRVDRRVESLHL